MYTPDEQRERREKKRLQHIAFRHRRYARRDQISLAQVAIQARSGTYLKPVIPPPALSKATLTSADAMELEVVLLSIDDAQALLETERIRIKNSSARVTRRRRQFGGPEGLKKHAALQRKLSLPVTAAQLAKRKIWRKRDSRSRTLKRQKLAAARALLES